MTVTIILIIIISSSFQANSFSPIDTTTCGSLKSCWQQSNGCSATTCQTLVTLQLNGSLLNIEMLAQTNGGNNPNINMAFSTDQSMGDDYTITCVYTSGSVNVLSGYTPNGRSHLFSSSPQTGISNIDGTYDSTTQRLSCRFSHVAGLVSVSGNTAVKDLSSGNSYYLLFATSTGVSSTSIANHGSSRWASDTQFTIGAVSNSSSSGESATKALEQAHGALMIVAWGGFIPLAVTLVRHMRLTLPFTKLMCGSKIWLQIHRAVEAVSVLLHCAAFVLIFVASGSLEVDVTEPTATSHTILGLILTALLLLNVILGIVQTFIDKSSPRVQCVFRWAHLVAGSLAEVVAVPTLLLGMALLSGTLSWPFWLLVGLVACLLLTEATFYSHAIIRKILRNYAIEERESGKDVQMPLPLIRSLFHQVLFGVAVALVVGLVAALIVGVSINGNETE